MFENKHTVWVVHIGHQESGALRAQNEGFICIGWTRIGNLAPHDTREKMKAAYRRAYPEAGDGNIRASYGQVFRFAHEMAIGDPVVYPIKGSRDLLIGEITGPYRWADDDQNLMENDCANIHRVNWLKRVPRIAFSPDALHAFGALATVATANDYVEEVIGLLKGDQVAALGPQTETAAEPSDPELQTGEGRVNLAERAVEETKDYLLRQWSGTGTEFEEVVAAVFRAMGYTATTQEGTHDLGVDVVAHRDPLGVEPPLLKIQCKSGAATVGAPALNQLRGLLNGVEKGVLVALGGFSTDARHVSRGDADLVLINGERFVELFLEHYDQLAPEWRHRFPLTRVYVLTS